ncbi:hypothetical protein ACLB2K_071031 [Fragaria x ananassa]
MAKRKSRARPAEANKKRVGNPDSTVLECPFCSGLSQTVIDMLKKEGQVVCFNCLRCFTMKITTSTRPIDIHREWCDDCKRNVTYDSDSSPVIVDSE